nr:MAG TPA: Terminase [Caudoviricetes sp.]
MELREYKRLANALKMQDSNKYSTWDNIMQLCLNMYEDSHDYLKYCLKLSKAVKLSAQRLLVQNQDVRFEDLYWQALKFEAPHLFDSYLLYLERKRLEQDRFYLPKRKQLNVHGLIQAMQDLEDDKLDILSISMPPGTQKCQPLYSKILTPNGFIQMGDVKVGTKVISGTGKVATVLSISPRKKRKMYEVTFDDGSKTRCSDNHLWTVQTRDDRRRKNKDGSEKYRTIELSEMLKNYKVENGKRCNYSVDYVPKIDCFKKKDFFLHPYVIGALIGDGGLTGGSVLLSSVDRELLDRFDSFLPNGYNLKFRDRCTYSVNGHEGNNAKAGSLVRKELDRLGLFGKKSIDKFIPKDYLYGSYEQRLWLLRGLMDTDGSASKSYCTYATISEQLADDVCELVHSLGGYASKNKRKAGYKKDGKYKQCNDYFEIVIQFTSGMDSIFSLTRKAEKYVPKRKVMKRFISKIEYIGEEECQCIYIDDESHLYITDDYIITHNTTLEKFFCSWIIGRHPDDFSLFFSHSGDITRMFYDGVMDITTNSDEYCWQEIFPDVKFHSTNAKRETINFNKYKPFSNIQCTSVGSKNAGKVRANRYLYCDDLIGGIEEALNKNILDKLWRIYGTDAKQRKMDGCKEIHIATRWSVHDVIGRLKDIYDGDDRAKFIAVPDIDPVTGKSNFDYKYNGFSVEFFHDQERTMDEISYKCLYKNEPIEREGLLYADEELRRFITLPITEPDAVWGICDTKNKGTDFLFLPCMLQYGNDFYLTECVCDDNSNYGIQYERTSDLIVNTGMQQCQFESNNGGDRVALEVSKLVEEKGGHCNITTKYTESNKETKIIVNADWVKKHVLFRDRENYKPKEDYGKMMGFLLSYSVRGKNPHDDVPDGLASFALFVTTGFVRAAQIIQSPV